jgi:hypothetical protein
MAAYAAPTLVVALVGVILGLANMRRAGSAATMAMLGSGLIGLTSLVSLVMRIVVWQQFKEGGMPVERYSQLLSLISIVSSIGTAGGLALVVIAVFVGRNARPNPGVGEEEA